MNQFDDKKITEEVLSRFAGTPDPRLRQIMTSLTTHLHAFVRDVEPTFDEWMYAIQFLTRVGHTCDDVRQEYILLSDVMGVSMLVDALNHKSADGATDSTVLGPFFVQNAKRYEQGEDISEGMAGEPLYTDVKISDTAGKPIAGAEVDLWQSDAEGFYDVQKPGLEHSYLRGRLTTDADGHIKVWSILPTAYPIPYDGPVGDLLKATNRHPWRPAHLHFMIAAPGFETLVTHLFVEGDQYLTSDAVFGVKDSLICQFPEHPAGSAPDGRTMSQPYRTLSYDFTLKRA